jgi:hypothetical protein
MILLSQLITQQHLQQYFLGIACAKPHSQLLSILSIDSNSHYTCCRSHYKALDSGFVHSKPSSDETLAASRQAASHPATRLALSVMHNGWIG